MVEGVYSDGGSKWIKWHDDWVMIFIKIVIYFKIIYQSDGNMCLDIYTAASNGKLNLWACHGTGLNQFFALTKSGQILTAEDLCLSIRIRTAILERCSENDGSQLWNYDSEVWDQLFEMFEKKLYSYVPSLQMQWIVHRASNHCLQFNGTDVILGACNPNSRFYFHSSFSASS